MKFIKENFEIHKTLNPNLFNLEDSTLKEDVRERLIEIADKFINNLKENTIPVKVVDYWLVGSSAAYNYGEFSDIDLHIIVNTDIVEDSNILKLLYDYVRSNFNKNYNILVKGQEVEIYLEDINTTSVSNGIYSLKKNKWIKMPSKEDPTTYDVESTEEYKKWKLIYKNLKDTEIEDFINNLYLLRKESLSKDGEYGLGNLIFKQFRNEGILDDLKERLYQYESAKLTLENINESKFDITYSDGPLSNKRETETIEANNVDDATEKAKSSSKAKEYSNVIVRELKDEVSGYSVSVLVDKLFNGEKYESNIERILTFKASNPSQIRHYYRMNYLGKYYSGDYVVQSKKDRFTSIAPTGYAVKFGKILDIKQIATNQNIIDKYEDATK